MLENSKELLKLEAMKRIITMIAKGRSAESARELFPHVVKNVVTKNTELKKLVYLYLTRYAEQEQDLALLSIATFQHALKDPNPLIRGSAIRVLSSIRVPMISPIVLIAIKDCANDMSPYVRKIAAHAIPKLVSLDCDIKDEVIDIIAKLLADKVSLVLGSAVAAFEQVCPDRFDLIHQNYRKLCQLLVDVDEWGQIIIINMLVRYARTQFINPNRSSSSSSAGVDPDHMLLIRSVKPLLQSRNSGVVLAVIQLYLSVAPHFEITASLVRPLIRLLHSHYEIQLIILKNIVTLTSAEFNQKWLEDNGLIQNNQNTNDKSTANGEQSSSPLLLSTDSDRSKQQNGDIQKDDNDGDSDDDDDDEESDHHHQSNNQTPMMIRTIKSLFEPYLKSFFVKANDSTQIKILKLEILTNLSNTGNYISLVLREFQAYILNYQDDLEFMSATIESIGQCASRIKEIAPVCLNGLVSLLSNRNETIVAQSIVVIRTQIINKDQSIISMIVKQIVRLMGKISQPQARATIVWIVAEFCHRNRHARRLAPNVLLQIAKTFCHEHDLVKLQALNLAAKLSITMINDDDDDNVDGDGNVDGDNIDDKLEKLDIDRERLRSLITYVFNLAKYDLNYDVRDRGRFLKHLIGNPQLARRILLMPKQQPNVSQRNHLLVQQQQQQINADVIMADQLPLSSSSATIHQQCSSSLILASSNDSIRYRFGTLSHFLGKRMQDYEELPDYPINAPDSSVRKQQPESISTHAVTSSLDNNSINMDDKYRLRQRNGFLDDVDVDVDVDEEEEDSDDYDEDEDDEEFEDEEEVDDEDYEEVDDNGDDEEVSEDEEDDDDDNELEDEEEEEEKVVKPIPKSKQQKSSKSTSKQPSDVDLLLDLSDLNMNDSNNGQSSISPFHQPLLPTMMMSGNSNAVQYESQDPYRILESPESVTYKEFELLDATATDGFKISYRFPRINESTKTLVELIVKCTLKFDDNRNQSRITVQPPSNGSIQFKNIEVSYFVFEKNALFFFLFFCC